MAIILKNLAKSTLSTGITSAVLTLNVQVGAGALFPTLGAGDYFYAALQNASGTIEFVKVTARVGDVMTIVRAQGGTTAIAWAAGDIFAQRLTIETFQDFVQQQLQTARSIQTIAGTNTITGTIAGLAAYTTQAQYSFVAAATNTGATTINISGLGARSIFSNGAALVGGELLIGNAYLLLDNGTQLNLISSSLATLRAGLVANTFTGGQNFARSTIVQSTAAMDLFALSNTIDGTGAALTVNAIVNAPQAGAIRRFYGLVGTIWTNNAMFAVDTGANFTFAANDYIDIEAITVSTYKVHVVQALGNTNTVNLTGNQTIAGQKTFSLQPIVPTQSMVRLNTANGYGSTNTKIKRFTTTVTNQGTDITYADSATLGASFTINTNGVYAINYCESGAAGMDIGLSVNTAQPTVSIVTITAANTLSISTTSAVNTSSLVSFTGYFIATDVVRPHTDGAANGASRLTLFTITRVS